MRLFEIVCIYKTSEEKDILSRIHSGISEDDLDEYDLNLAHRMTSKGLLKRRQTQGRFHFQLNEGKNQTLIGFLKMRGGIRDHRGELRHRGVIRRFPGLVNLSGMTLDHAREAAAEAGYLGADVEMAIQTTTIDDLIDQIMNPPVYSAGDLLHQQEFEGEQQYRAQMRELKQAKLLLIRGLEELEVPTDPHTIDSVARQMVEHNLDWEQAYDDYVMSMER